MAGLSDAYELLVLDKILGATDFTPAGTVYVSLHTADPGETGANEKTVGSQGYARVAVTNNATNWPAASSGQKKNGTSIEFSAATADWGTITHWGLWSAASSGTFILGGSLGTSKTVNNGDSVRFSVNAIVITLD